MATLYKRATPSQAKILRMVEGAIKDAVNSHPDSPVGPRMMRSIAKRATGTITSQWGDVLALRDAMSKKVRGGSSATPSSITEASGSGISLLPGVREKSGARRNTSRRAPIILLRSQISRQMRFVKQTNPDKAEAWIEVLKMIDALTKK